MTLILLRSPLEHSQIRMIQSILNASPENRAVLITPSVRWPDPKNPQILSVDPEPGSPFQTINWSDLYALIKQATRLLVPAIT